MRPASSRASASARSPRTPIGHASSSRRQAGMMITCQCLINEMHGPTFQNPGFYRRQKPRLSTALPPRAIACAQDLPQHLALPRGCGEALSELLRNHGATLRVEDRRVEGRAIEVSFRGELTPVQQDVVGQLLAHDAGVFVASPGIGKMVVGAYLTAVRGRSTLIMVHRKPLLDQWRAQLALFLGVDAKAIGPAGAGKRGATGWGKVTIIQRLTRDGEVDETVPNSGHVMVDECHPLPAVSFERVLTEVRARFVLGLTATPYRRDGHQPIIHMQCG